jgi:hypothetical protein
MRFLYLVTAEVERDEGKFASRDELAEQIISEIEGADPGSLSGDEGGAYSVVDWDVSEQDELTQSERKALAAAVEALGGKRGEIAKRALAKVL